MNEKRNIIFEKKLKAGLKKCPLHRFGSVYKPVEGGWYQCEKCHAYYRMPEVILKDVDAGWSVRIFNNGNAWTFL